MPDLIDRKALLKELRADYKDAIKGPGEAQLIAIGLESAIDIVKGAPTASLIVHGSWIVWKPPEDMKHMIPSYYCSVCKKNAAFVTGDMEPIPPQLFNRLIYHYCPHCGAKMGKLGES